MNRKKRIQPPLKTKDKIGKKSNIYLFAAAILFEKYYYLKIVASCAAAQFHSGNPCHSAIELDRGFFLFDQASVVHSHAPKCGL